MNWDSWILSYMIDSFSGLLRVSHLLLSLVRIQRQIISQSELTLKKS